MLDKLPAMNPSSVVGHNPSLSDFSPCYLRKRVQSSIDPKKGAVARCGMNRNAASPHVPYSQDLRTLYAAAAESSGENFQKIASFFFHRPQLQSTLARVEPHTRFPAIRDPHPGRGTGALRPDSARAPAAIA